MKTIDPPRPNSPHTNAGDTITANVSPIQLEAVYMKEETA